MGTNATQYCQLHFWYTLRCQVLTFVPTQTTFISGTFYFRVNVVMPTQCLKLTAETNRPARLHRANRPTFSQLEAMELFRQMGEPPPSYNDTVNARPQPPRPLTIQMQGTATSASERPPDYNQVKQCFSLIDFEREHCIKE